MLKRVLGCILAVSLFSFNGYSAEFISSIDYEPWGGLQAEPGSPAAIQYIINWDFVEEYYSNVGDGIYWSNGETGSYVFDAGNTPDFDDFTEYITDGLDYSLYMRVAVPGMASEYGKPESQWNFGDPDLFGYQIEFMVLQVYSTSVTKDGDYISFSGDISWEFYGTPTPEPSTLLMLGMGIAAFRKRKH
jgi:hypothetical protein